MATKKAGGTSTAIEKIAVTLKSATKKAAIKQVPVDTKVQKKPTSPKVSTATAANIAATNSNNSIEITFKLRFTTQYGQSLYLSGSHLLLGENDIEKAVPLSYIDKDFWGVTITVNNAASIKKNITYNYVLKNTDGSISYDWGSDKSFNPSSFSNEQTLIIDSWNYAGYFENAFYSEPFQKVLFKSNYTPVEVKVSKKATHTFRAKAPLLSGGQTLCVIGAGKKLGNWGADEVLLLSRK